MQYGEFSIYINIYKRYRTRAYLWPEGSDVRVALVEFCSDLFEAFPLWVREELSRQIARESKA